MKESYKVLIDKDSSLIFSLDEERLIILRETDYYSNRILSNRNKIFNITSSDCNKLNSILISRDGLMTMSINLKLLGIEHPETYHPDIAITNFIFNIKDYLEDNTDYMFKLNYKARSLGKFRFDKTLIKELSNTIADLRNDYLINNYDGDMSEFELIKNSELYNNCKEVFDNLIKDKIPKNIEIRDKDESSMLFDSLFIKTSHSYIIQKYVKDIKTEYRMGWFYGCKSSEIFIKERDIVNNNLSDISNAKKEKIFNYKCKNGLNLYDNICKLGKLCRTPRLSIDLYETIDGNIGIMEYQTEAWTDDWDIDVRKMNTDAVIRMIKDFEKEYEI